MRTLQTATYTLGIAGALALAACQTDVAPEADATTTTVPTDASGAGPITQGAAAPTTAPIDAVTGYLDPVCGMKVAADAPIRHTHEGVTHGFCSEACRERFAADPATYLAALED